MTLTEPPRPHPHPRIWAVFPENMAEVEFKPKPAWLQARVLSILILLHCPTTAQMSRADRQMRPQGLTVVTWPSGVVEEGDRKLGQRPMQNAVTCMHN